MQSQQWVLSVWISSRLEATLGVSHWLSDWVMRVNRSLTFWSRGLQTWVVWQWQPATEKIRITVTVLLNPANTSTFGAPGSAPGRHLHRLKRVPNPLSLILYYITLASTERNVCGWNQEVVTGVNSLQRHADSTKKHWYSSTVFQVAEVSHLQDGVVLPGVFGVVPLQETPPRGAARPSKLRQVQVSKAQLQENTREFAPFSGNLTWISWIQTAAERMLACTPPPALNSLNYCLT